MNDRPNMRAYDDERRKRARRLFHWSLDMPPEDEDVDVRVNKGMTWKEMAVIAAAGLGGLWMFNGHQQLPSTPLPSQPPQQISAPIDSEYEVRFFDAEGRRISVPHISQKR